VFAFESNAIRDHDVEETASITLRFENGALGTVNLSDAIAAPWSWELTARENPAYPATKETCYWIGGTRASLDLPALIEWSHPGEKSWWLPITATQHMTRFDDPLIRQIDHFAQIIVDDVAPLVTIEDGVRALAVVEAVKRSAEQRQPIAIDDLMRQSASGR
jgi:predicted dehydrogenase